MVDAASDGRRSINCVPEKPLRSRVSLPPPSTTVKAVVGIQSFNSLKMLLVAAVIGAASTSGGLQAAYWLDTPTGPTIVSLAAVVFVLCSLVDLGRRRLARMSSSDISS